MIRIERAGRAMYGILLDKPVRGVTAVFECCEDDCMSAFVITCNHNGADCTDEHVEEALRWMLAHDCACTMPILGRSVVGEA